MTAPFDFSYLLPVLKKAGALDAKDLRPSAAMRSLYDMEYVPREEGPRRFPISSTAEAIEIPQEELDRRQKELEARQWAEMISGEAYQPAEQRSPTDFANMMVEELPRGLLTGDYPSPESLAVGMGIESTPVVGDLLFGARDIGLGLHEGSLPMIYAGMAGVAPGIPSTRGVMNLAKKLGAIPGDASASLLRGLKPTNVTPGTATMIRDLPYDDAVAAARRGEHLRAGQGGRIVGAPASVRVENINDMRNQLDFHMVRGHLGRDWYERARAGGVRIAGDDPQRRGLLGGPT
jgi:hypothetical protein